MGFPAGGSYNGNYLIYLPEHAVSISPSSSIAKIAGDLLQLSQQRQQQIDLHLQVSESTRRVRDQAIDQSIATITKQSNLVHEVKEAAAKMRASGSIDTWA